jgi:hypothetical protein
MEGAVQEDWLHCIPKDPACKEERVNLTFRYTHLFKWIDQIDTQRPRRNA